MVMDGRPVAELKKRWIDIKYDKQRPLVEYELDEDSYLDEDDYDGEFEKERHVSFESSSDEDVCQIVGQHLLTKTDR